MNNSNENKTILVVDDDIDFLRQMKLILKNQNYNYICAESKKEAEDILEDSKPDLAIIDLMMEHTDAGFALAYNIKKLDSDIPIIIVTAVKSETGIGFDVKTEEEKTWIKADTLLTKPLRPEQILDEINKYLN